MVPWLPSLLTVDDADDDLNGISIEAEDTSHERTDDGQTDQANHHVAWSRSFGHHIDDSCDRLFTLSHLS